MISKSLLLSRLPVFNGNRDVITGEQTTTDIVKEVLAAHKFFANDYDKISEYFSSREVERQLFNFCKLNLPYCVEDENLQTTRSPAGILAMASMGCDCKHYAGFIAGVIDSLNRKGVTNLDWCYRFASYNVFDADAKHVFIVVKKRGGEVWIDPVLREFNSRSPSPIYSTDKKVNTMALVRMSGVQQQAKPKIVSSHNIVRRSDLMKKNQVACGCANMGDGSEILSFVQANPIPAILVGGVAVYLIYSLIK